MGDVSLLPIFSQSYDVGRPVILIAKIGTPPNDVFGFWDESAPIVFENPGNTEGEFVPAGNSEYSSLKLDENLGPVEIKTYHKGDAPSFAFKAFANPDTLALYSPTGSASGGNSRWRKVREFTVWVAPEQLFLKYLPTGEAQEVIVDPIALTKDGAAFDAEAQRLFELSTFFWKVRFERTMIPYRAEDGGKALVDVNATIMADITKPEGHIVWTIGKDLAASGIDLNGGS